MDRDTGVSGGLVAQESVSTGSFGIREGKEGVEVPVSTGVRDNTDKLRDHTTREESPNRAGRPPQGTVSPTATPGQPNRGPRGEGPRRAGREGLDKGRRGEGPHRAGREGVDKGRRGSEETRHPKRQRNGGKSNLTVEEPKSKFRHQYHRTGSFGEGTNFFPTRTRCQTRP